MWTNEFQYEFKESGGIVKGETVYLGTDYRGSSSKYRFW